MMVRSLVANGLGYGLLNIPSLNEKAPDGKALEYVALEDDLRPMALGLAAVRSEKAPGASRVRGALSITADSIPGMCIDKRRRRG